MRHKEFLERFSFGRFKELMADGDRPILIDVRRTYDKEEAVE